MAAFSAIIGAVGLGLSAYGTYSNYTNSKKASEAQQAAAAKQAEIAQLQASNVDVQKKQLDLTSSQQLLQNQTQRTVIQDQAKADALRMQAAELDATRRRREAVRAGIVARANSLVAASNQGANEVGSTAVAQSAATISGQANTNILGINQSLDFGKKLYDINKNISDTYLNASYKNDEFVAQSKTLQGQVLDTQKKIYQLGGEASQSYAQAAQYQGNAALGSGLASLGGSFVNNFDKIGSLTKYFTGAFGSSSTQDYSNFSQPTDI